MSNEPWSSSWGNSPSPSIQPNSIPNPKPSNPWDAKSQDEVLLHWQSLKDQFTALKEVEMEFRKYVVSRAFPNPHEGMNKIELGKGYELKAQIKYNYKLADNDTVEKQLDKIAAIGNEGQFIAGRLVSWTPNFLISEYRTLQEEKEKGNPTAIAILKEIELMLEITEAAPTLELKEPKEKKK